MFTRKLITATAIAILSTATLPALAHTHRGTPVQSGYADREVTLTEGAKYLNVQRNETVKINIAGKSFAWRFDTFGTPVFSLGEIAPQIAGANGVMVYVAEDPAYVSGN
jgi:heme/copper-type cytochrome/quinol oxidase subunit 2